MTTNILLVEDEITVGSTVSERLNSEGFQTTWSKTISEAADYLQKQKFDLAILDVQLPDGNGFDFANLIREKTPQTSIVFLTAMGTPEDRIKGLESGAEDYIVKPFHFKELLLRLQNALKRAHYVENHPGPKNSVRLGNATVNFAAFQISHDIEFGTLTHKECALLKLLYERKGQVVSRDDILNLVWSTDDFPTPRTVDNFILKLRRWIEPQPDQPTIIKSIRGVGYQLNDEFCQEIT